MLKKIGFIIIGLSLVASPFIASAQGVDIQAQVAALLAQIKQLQIQIAQLHGQPQPAASCVDLFGNLTLGSTGSDVSSLQNYLASKGYFTASATGYYGFLTAQAVGKLQISLGIVSSASDNAFGIVGPRTRAAIACSGVVPTQSNFSASPTSGAAPLQVGFNSNVGGTINFGDGASGSMNPAPVCYGCTAAFTASHTYTSAGTYTAMLMQPNICDPRSAQPGICTGLAPQVIGTVTITVLSCPPNADNCNFRTTGAPSISGVDGPTQLAAGQSGTWSVHVNDASGYLSYSVRWGDESMMPTITGTGTSVSVASSGTFTHTYANAGTYSPVFTVTNANGQSASASATVVVGGINSVNFFASPMSGSVPLTVHFSASDCSNTSSYSVDFGDGSTAPMNAGRCTPQGTQIVSISANVDHTYISAGTYTAKLMQSDPMPACYYATPPCMMLMPVRAPQVIGTMTITVSGGISQGTLSASPTYGSTPLAVHFATTNMTQSPSTIHDWYSVDFGDGTTGYLALSGCSSSIGCADHTYAQSGTYTARIVHHPDPAAYCPTNDGTYCGSTLNFNTVTISVSSCPPNADNCNFRSTFSASPTSGTAPLVVVFNGSIVGYTAYIDFGDGTSQLVGAPICDPGPGGSCPTTHSIQASHTYTSHGTYTANLTAGVCRNSVNPCTEPLLGTATITVNGSTSNTFTIPSTLTLVPGQSVMRQNGGETDTLALNSVHYVSPVSGQASVSAADFSWQEYNCGSTLYCPMYYQAPTMFTLYLYNSGGSSYTTALGHVITLTSVGSNSATVDVSR